MVSTRQNVFRIVSKCPKMSQDVPKCQKMSKNVLADYGRKWSEMTGKTVQMLQTRQKVFQIIWKCLNVPKGHKMSNSDAWLSERTCFLFILFLSFFFISRSRRLHSLARIKRRVNGSCAILCIALLCSHQLCYISTYIATFATHYYVCTSSLYLHVYCHIPILITHLHMCPLQCCSVSTSIAHVCPLKSGFALLGTVERRGGDKTRHDDEDNS